MARSTRSGSLAAQLSGGARRALLPLLILAPTLPAAQQSVDPCPIPPGTTPDPGTFQHRWAGLVAEVFTLDGETVWTAEDGGRIRRRDGQTGAWAFQSVPFEVQGTLRGMHFLSNALNGWAVGAQGWVLRTSDGGATWNAVSRVPGAFGLTEWEELHDVWFAENGDDGWLLGEHGLWYTESGGVCWYLADMYASPVPTVAFSAQVIQNNSVKLWGLDIRTDGEDDFLGIAVGQPGWILRSTDFGRTWFRVLAGHSTGISDDPGECLHEGVHNPSWGPWFELWDVRISQPPDPVPSLILVVGGVKTRCGLVLASTDSGLTWARERHECEIDPGFSCITYDSQGNIVAYDPAYDPSLPPYRHTEFKTLYGVALDSGDHSAVAVGYNGQHLIRDFLSDGTPVWRDRSSFAKPSQYLANPSLDVTVFPLYAASLGRVGPQRRDWLSGAGGHIRSSLDAGQSWSDEAIGEQFRIRDVWFKADSAGDDIGWQAGQFFRLARSTDGGTSWSVGSPPRIFPGTETLTSIAFGSGGLRGISVGTSIPPYNSGEPRRGPRILWTDDFGQPPGWQEPTTLPYSLTTENAYSGSMLRRVAWARDAANQQFWAVGTNGLILRTLDGGDTWTQVVLNLVPANPPLPIPDHDEVDLFGVAAASPSSIVVVGSGPDGLGGREARAYAFASTHWIQVPLVSGGTGSLELLTDVAAMGSEVYAVGNRRHPGQAERTGVVLRYDPTAGPQGTGAFVTHPGPFDPAEIEGCGIEGSGLQNQILTQVELTSNGDLWIAGLCGQVWQRLAATGTWREHKSQTDADARGLMFLSPSRGYLPADGGDKTNQVLVRYDGSSPP